MRSSQEQSNRHFQIQIDEQRRQYSIDYIINLTKMIRVALENNLIITDIKSYPQQFFSMIRTDCRRNPPKNINDIWKYSFKRMKSDRYFDSEVHILGEILERIELLENPKYKLRAKIIVKGLIPQKERFLFKCYAYAWHPQASMLLEKWPDFCHAPPEFQTYLENSGTEQSKNLKSEKD